MVLGDPPEPLHLSIIARLPRPCTRAVVTPSTRLGNGTLLAVHGPSLDSRVKQRIRPMLGFKRINNAVVTISGIELAAKALAA